MAVRREDGQIVNGPDELLGCWSCHFDRILNIQSQFNEETIKSLPASTEKSFLDEVPTLEEVLQAIKSLKSGKVGGSSGILPEMLIYSGKAMQERIHALVSCVWMGRSVPADWKHAEIIPILKKRRSEEL